MGHFSRLSQALTRGEVVILDPSISSEMPYQSTKKQYKSKRERKKEHSRRLRIIALFVLLLGMFFILKDWRAYWAYLKTYFM